MRKSSHDSPSRRLWQRSNVEGRLRLPMRRMLSPKTQTNLKNAQSYFDEHLAVGDYYSEGEQVIGEWIGRGCCRARIVSGRGQGAVSQALRKSASEDG